MERLWNVTEFHSLFVRLRSTLGFSVGFRPNANSIPSQDNGTWLHNKSFARRFGVLYYVFELCTRERSRSLSHSRVVSAK